MELNATHIITSLHADGAQQALVRILTSLGGRARGMRVVSLSDEGTLGSELDACGIPVHTLGMRRGVPSVGRFWDLVRLLRGSQPAVVVTWLYHGDVLGGLAAKMAGRLPVVWNVRRSSVPDAQAKRSTRLAAYTCCKLARRVPGAVVFCSGAGRDAHVAGGYPPSLARVIPNGFDFATFRPIPNEREGVRAELNLPPSANLIGHFGRFHADKDHATLLAAAARVVATAADVHFVLCGRGVDEDNTKLTGKLQSLSLGGRCHLLGHRSDAARWMGGMDVVVSSSRTEGFTNAVGEALACGVPCVGTDVGETRRIIGPGGEVVRPGEPADLAAACLRLLRRSPQKRQQIGELGRRHVEANFEISRLAEEHLRVWKTAARGAVWEAGEFDVEMLRRRAA